MIVYLVDLCMIAAVADPAFRMVNRKSKLIADLAAMQSDDRQHLIISTG